MTPRPLRYRRSRLPLVGLTAAIFAAAFSGAAFGQASPTLQSKAADVGTLLTKATSDPGGVRVIVTLSVATSGAGAAPGSSSTDQLSSATSTLGPLGDGQSATTQQSQVLATHLGNDPAKQQRWAPRLIANTPYMAMNVTAAELEALAADGNVVSIHEDGQLQTGLTQSVPLIGMNAAFAVGTTGINRMVAVLDTGVEYGHVFTTPRVTNATCFSTTNASFTTLCPNGMATQVGGTAGQNCGVAGCDHGTHVAGIAAGNRASGSPISGVAKGATILAVQVFSRRNSDNALTAFDSDMLAALNDTLTRVSGGGELANRGLRAINMSIWDSGLEVAGTCDALARAMPFKTVIDSLLVQKVATVIISGNGSKKNLSAFPGCVSSAVTVGSTTKADAVSSFSNMSPVVDLLAPGSSITSSINPTPNFGSKDGTSMAAPHVAGAFAAIGSACVGATIAQIETALKNTGTPVFDGRVGGTLTRPRIRVDLALEQLGCDAGPPGPPGPVSCQFASKLGEFNGDARADMFFRRTDGLAAIYFMNGLTIAAAQIVGTIGTEWTLVGIGDFNGDGRSDLLMRRPDGAIAIFLMNGAAIINAQIIGAIGTNWLVVGVGDFNGDGRADILTRRDDGTIAIYLLNGFTIVDAQIIGAIGLNWKIQGIADINGDGRADFLTRNTSTGQIGVYLLNGFNFIDAAIVGTVGLDWTIVGLGDFNGDGRADFITRRANGTLGMYLLNGTQLLAGQQIGAIGNDWTFVGTGDLNGDGRHDMVLRRTTGVVAGYLLNGFMITAGDVIGNLGTNYTNCYGQGSSLMADAGQ